MIRKLYKGDLTQANLHQDREPVESYEDANLISSELVGVEGYHAPVLDIDFEARLVPSTTEGHYHLYLDTAIPWEKYAALLDALAEAGVIEPGYAMASKARGASFVRKPEVKKQPGDANSAGDLAAWMAANL